MALILHLTIEKNQEHLEFITQKPVFLNELTSLTKGKKMKKAVLAIIICGSVSHAKMLTVVGVGTAQDGSDCRLEMDLNIADDNKTIQKQDSRIFYIKNTVAKMFMSLDREKDQISGSVNPIILTSEAKELKYSLPNGFNLGLGSFSRIDGKISIVQKSDGSLSAEVKWIEEMTTRLDEVCTVAAKDIQMN
jgi:hypothetical protein